MQEQLVIGDIQLRSRLIVGTGKYPDFAVMKEAISASGADLVTVAIRRVDLNTVGSGDNLMDHLPDGVSLLPNTAGCYSTEDAVRTAHLGREACSTPLVKVEVIGDEKTLYPDNEALLEATRILVKDGFTVMPYMIDDPILAKKLQDEGAACVMPLAAPIGSGLGIRNPYSLKILIEAVDIPVIVDAGVGTASDAAVALELGCDGVLMNTGIAGAGDPVKMAHAMRKAVEAGRLAFEAGRIERKLYATASSPLTGLID